MDKLVTGSQGRSASPSDGEETAMSIDLQAATDFVRRLLRQQAEFSMERWASVRSPSYKDARDFTTEVDLEIEERIKEALRERFPDHGLQGEETKAENPGAIYQWLIDPIDGTKWYAGRSSLFAISVGLLHQGDPVSGVVYLPASRQCFSAYRGGGAELDGQPLSGPRVDVLAKAILNVDAPKTDVLPQEERRWFEQKLILLTRRVYRVRALGQGSLAACWLASGAIEAYVDLTGYIQPEDLAAGRVIMQECGVRVEYLHTAPGPERLVAAPATIWGELWSVLSS